MRLTPEMIQTVRETLRQYGVLSMAAAQLGCRTGDLTAAIARDADFAAEVAEALEEHKDALYVEALQRATGRAGSDALLGKLLEAKLPEQFDSKVRAGIAAAAHKPTGVRLRSFVETDDGVVDANVKTEPAAPAQPSEPLRIGYRYL